MANNIINRLFLLTAVQLLISSVFLNSFEYIYPVIALSNNNVYCIHQNFSYSINLINYDVITGHLDPALLSCFNPTLLRLLPCHNRISFSDNGIIKIKDFAKRSAQSIEIMQPLYNITYFEWINNEQFFINALYNNRFGIFELDVDGAIDSIIFSRELDFLYPQKIGDNLFLIEKSYDKQQAKYRVLKSKYVIKNKKNSESFKSWEKYNNKKNNYTQKEYDAKEIDFLWEHNTINLKTSAELQDDYNAVIPILDFDIRPIAFLIMTSDQEGFVLEYLPSIFKNNNDDNYLSNMTIDFCLHHIYEQPVGWQSECILTFSIPACFLLYENDFLLYERMTPLLPKKIGNYIYYVDSKPDIEQENNYLNLNLFRYDISLGITEQLTYATLEGEHYLCPLLVGNTVYCGKSLLEGEKLELVCLGSR